MLANVFGVAVYAKAIRKRTLIDCTKRVRESVYLLLQMVQGVLVCSEGVIDVLCYSTIVSSRHNIAFQNCRGGGR